MLVDARFYLTLLNYSEIQDVLTCVKPAMKGCMNEEQSEAFNKMMDAALASSSYLCSDRSVQASKFYHFFGVP